MPKTKAYIPDHYHGDADAYAADLERELAGRRNRLDELRAMGVSTDDKVFTDTLSEEDAVLGELKGLGRGPKPDKPAEEPAEEPDDKPAAKAAKAAK